MPMRPEFVEAIETRLTWMRHMEQVGVRVDWQRDFYQAPFDAYEASLRHGELFVMVPEFCRMVNTARRTVPDDLTFDPAWLQAKAGWLYFAEPFELPFIGGQIARMRKLTAPEQMAVIWLDVVNPLHARDTRTLVHPKLLTPDVAAAIRERVEDWVGVLGGPEGDALREAQTILLDQILNGTTEPQAEPMRTFGIALARFANDLTTVSARIAVRAVGWYQEGCGPMLGGGMSGREPSDLTVMFFSDRPRRIDAQPYAPIAHFGLRAGAPLGERVEAFEAWASRHHERNPGVVDAPYDEAMGMWRHEIRLTYTLMFLMSQKLAVHPRVATDRATRRRAEHNRQVAPPFLQVVTLRRLEADRQRDPKGQDVDWAWRWIVTGHWRHQFYPAEGVHKRIFIEAFVKGPEDKPFKTTAKIFAAER